MMLMSFKLDWKKLITFFAVALVLAGALAGLRWATAAWWRSDAVSVRITRHSGATEEERQRFIASFGWTVPAAPEEVKEVLIPREFDEVYIQYNNLQKKQGCDLHKYRGKRCVRYTYKVENYPGEKEGVRLNLLVYNEKIIGGDVMSVRLDGFMHGFAMPES